MSGHTYIHGLAASAAPRRAASLELRSILAARRDSCAVQCSQIVASAAMRRATPRRVAVRRIVNQALRATRKRQTWKFFGEHNLDTE